MNTFDDFDIDMHEAPIDKFGITPVSSVTPVTVGVTVSIPWTSTSFGGTTTIVCATLSNVTK